MIKNLLIIESPNKIETIKKYIGDKDFKILATIGHIRDLSTRGMGFDEKTLEPNWIVPSHKKRRGSKEKDKHEIIKEIKTFASKAETIYLATDPDREGEAIAWHVYEVLNKSDQEKCYRITFNEITKSAITEALDRPRKIDMMWVQSQFARRILDRLVGYKLSKLVRNKIKAKSAGRVQSVALKFIYDREKEIKKFKEKKWWTVDVTLANNAKLILRDVSKSIKGLKFSKTSDDQQGSGVDFADDDSAKKLINSLDAEYKVYAIDDPKPYTTNPREPYKTSTLQQDAINKLGWNVAKVTSVSQKLYEGVKVGGEHMAMISYPRTDSTRISETFASKAKEYIIDKYGEKYYQFRVFGGKPTAKKVEEKDKKIQDAHEAIRVIDPIITPESVKTKLSKDEYSLYKVIWLRTIAAYMTPAKYENTIVRIENAGNKFYTYNRKQVFDGYKKIYKHFEDHDVLHDIDLKNISVGKKYKALSIESKEHTSQPPPRFNQASLIKALDEAGVGRPSTYKSMANMAVERGYAKLENRAYYMLPLGDKVIECLDKYFPDIVDKDFTKEMEEHLDEIAQKEENWKEWILGFKPKFEKNLKDADKNMEKVEAEKAGKKCPKCGADMVVRYARRTGAKFIGCSGYPKCTYAEFPDTPTKTLDEKCPECGKALIERYNRRGQKFIGCTGYPKCHFIKNIDKKEVNKEETENDKDSQ